MRDAEQAIEMVLAGFREAEMPQGMEGRILRVVKERAREPKSGAWRMWRKRPAYAATTLGGVLVVGLALVVLVMLLARKAAQVEPGRRFLNVAAARRAIATKEDDETGVPQRLKPLAQSAPASPNVPVLETGKGVGTFQDENTTDDSPDYDALAMSEMLAPSKPAPPLPLTHQERLLAQVVHKGEPEALATLQPDVRAKQMEISKAEFQDFFDPPPVKDNE